MEQKGNNNVDLHNIESNLYQYFHNERWNVLSKECAKLRDRFQFWENNFVGIRGKNPKVTISVIKSIMCKILASISHLISLQDFA